MWKMISAERYITPRLLLLLPPLVLAATLGLAACGPQVEPVLGPIPGGDARRGAAAIRSYGCGACHLITGIAEADGMVGPPLEQWARREIIAGQIPNTPDNLLRWIREPQAIEPGTAMPDMGVSLEDARDIAAYLATLK